MTTTKFFFNYFNLLNFNYFKILDLTKKNVNYSLNEFVGTLVIIMLMIERFCYVMFVLPKILNDVV
jgi:hypothetical protein